MTDRKRFIEKQVAQAEEKKLGMTDNHNTINKYGGEDRTQQALSAKTRPPNTVKHEFPVGRKRGTV